MALEELPVELFQEIINNIKDAKTLITLTLVSKVIQNNLKGCNVIIKKRFNNEKIYDYLRSTYRKLKLVGYNDITYPCNECDLLARDHIVIKDSEYELLNNAYIKTWGLSETYCDKCYNNRPFKYENKQCSQCYSKCYYNDYMYANKNYFLHPRTYIIYCTDCHKKCRIKDHFNWLDPTKILEIKKKKIQFYDINYDHHQTH